MSLSAGRSVQLHDAFRSRNIQQNTPEDSQHHLQNAISALTTRSDPDPCSRVLFLLTCVIFLNSVRELNFSFAWVN
jgi:hypothetical protein